ncbi:MAG: NAD(P)/FAD-dependent oxidoreductase, partial [Gammaproteobacteria bacterium]
KHKDTVGSNAGYYELASGAEVQSYFEQVMRQRFLPSGRVQYFPMCEYAGNNKFTNTLSGHSYEVEVAKRVVDSTYFKTSVPSRHIRNYRVDNDVTCVAPNQLPNCAARFNQYCVVGAGKTAMDAAVWLLENHCPAERISWVCPRQSWLINRNVTQTSVDFFEESIGGFANQLEAIANAESVDDLFDRLEACGYMLRIDQSQRPTMFHFATLSSGEVEQLRKISNVISVGRVTEISAGQLTFANGNKLAMAPDTLYIDCTASAVDFTSDNSRPVFEDKLLTIQGLRMPNLCLSAAISAYVEANYEDDQTRNRLCQPVMVPNDPAGFIKTTLGNMMNQATWSGEPELSKFIASNRLDAFVQVISQADLSTEANQAIMNQLGTHLGPAMANLQKLASR